MSTQRAAAQHGRRRHLVVGLAIGAAAAAALVPATAGAAPLVAAYDTFVPGKGFEIAMVKVSNGAAVAVPAGVNTTADELHPALSPDGRFMVFMRTTLTPKLNGDIVPPPARELLMFDRQGSAGAVALQGRGAGPVFRRIFSSVALSFAIPPELNAQQRLVVARRSRLSNGVLNGSQNMIAAPPPAPSGQVLEIPHGGWTQLNDLGRSVDAAYLSLAYIDANTGALQTGLASLSAIREKLSNPAETEGSANSYGSAGAPASHPVPRNPDDYTALDLANGNDVNIQTLSWPAETVLTPAPAPITTTDPERMPAWSPDGLQLGFMRTTAGRRKLGVFDATPGIQTVLNSPLDLGVDAPTPQTRAYQSTWGGLSLALASSLDGGGSNGGVPQVGCGAACFTPLNNKSLLNVPLLPVLSASTVGQTVGIFVVRVTGTRKLLGRTVPRIRVVGRVPLGRTVRGVNRFRWNGKVNGRRLRAGTYLLTYRALKRGRVLNISNSIRLTVTSAGKIVNVRRQR
jgi:WD40 repeat protein